MDYYNKCNVPICNEKRTCEKYVSQNNFFETQILNRI